MDDGAPGEVKARKSASRDIEQSALTPHHMGHGRVDDKRPERKEEQHAAELHAFGEGSGDERGSNDGEHQLVDHEGLQRNGGSIIGVGSGAYPM